MRIINLELKNFRSFRHSGQIDLGERVNVIVGKNDSGKSALLESFRRFVYEQTNARQAGDDIHANGGSYDLQFDAVLNSKAELTSGNENFSEGDTLHFKCHYERGHDAYQYEVKKENGQNITPRNPNGILAYQRPEAPINAIDSLRKLKSLSGVGRDTYARLPNDGSNAASIVDDILTGGGADEDEFKRVMVDLLGYRIGAVNYQSNNKIIGKTLTSGKRITADKMGSGVSEVAFLVATMVISREKVIVIDEIENSIHPQLLKKLLAVIRDKSVSNNLQFIIGTHSNIVLTQLGGLDGSKVFRVSIDNDESSIQSIATPTERQDLLVELGYELSDLQLYDGFLLTEESSAQSFLEQIIIPKFLSHLDGKIKVVASGGADDVQTRYDLLGKLYVFQFVDPAYKRKSWVLCDGDDKGKDVVNKLKTDFPDGAERMYNLQNDKQIEHYYPSEVVSAFLTEKSLSTVDDLLQMSDKNKKRELKTELLESVLAKKDKPASFFKTDAQDLIDVINQIQP